MFISEALKTHLETSATINTESLVLTEWNMNMPDNIFMTSVTQAAEIKALVEAIAGIMFFTTPKVRL